MKKIAIHCVPRSGSTWLGQIFNSCPSVKYAFQPLFSHAFKDYLNEKSTADQINDFFEALKVSDDSFINQKEDRENGLVPTFDKDKNITAVVYKEVRYHYILETLLKNDPEIKIIGIIRNPLAVISSWLLAPKEFRADLSWKEAEEWNFAPKKNSIGREEYNGFQKWKEVSKLFEELEKKYPNNFKIVCYDDLISDVDSTVKELFQFCGLPFTDQTKSFIHTKNKNQENSYSVYKNVIKDDKWKDTLSKDVCEQITNELENTNLKKYLNNGI